MELADIENIIHKNHMLSKNGIEKIGIFGSFARGEEGNDIDILIEKNSNIESILSFKNELEERTKKKVDIVLEKYANPIILFRAKKEIVYVS